MNQQLQVKKEIDKLWDHAVAQDPELYDMMIWCEVEAKRKEMSTDAFICKILLEHDMDLANSFFRIPPS